MPVRFFVAVEVVEVDMSVDLLECLAAAERQSGYDRDHDEDEDRQSRCHAVVIGAAGKRDLVHERNQDVRGSHAGGGFQVLRPTTREQVDDVEVVEVHGEGRDQEGPNSHHEHGQRDGTEPLHCPGTVHFRGFVELRRNGLQCARGHQEHVRESEPQVHQQQRCLGQPGVVQPGDVRPAQQYLVDVSEVRVE